MKKGVEKIILVDDDEDDRYLFAEAIEKLDLQAELILLQNGQELLDYIKEIDRSLMSCIFLDLNMPVVSGMDILQQLHQTLRRDALFVTIYSTSNSQSDIENAYKSGAHGYIQKPSSFKQLTSLIRKAINACVTNSGKQLAKNEFVLNKG